MIIHFATTKGLSTFLIRVVTRSKWSHVALQIKNEVYEVTFERGVSRTTLFEFRKRYPVSDVVAVNIFNTYSIRKWLNSQIGKDYDYGGLIGFLDAHRDWEEPSKWFCSELIAEALVREGIIHPKVRSSRVTPNDLYELLINGDNNHG